MFRSGVRRPINSEVDSPDHLLVAKAAYRPPLTPAVTDLLKQRYKHLAGLWVKSRGNEGGGKRERERETRMPDVIIPRRWLKRHFNRRTEKKGEGRVVVTSLSVDNRIFFFFFFERMLVRMVDGSFSFCISGRRCKRFDKEDRSM